MARPVSAPPPRSGVHTAQSHQASPEEAQEMNCGALRKGHLTMAVAPKHGRLEEAEQHHQSHAILECMFMIPEVFDLLDELVDERKHTCGQPGGVQWGTGLRHQHRQQSDESANFV